MQLQDFVQGKLEYDANEGTRDLLSIIEGYPAQQKKK